MSIAHFYITCATRVVLMFYQSDLFDYLIKLKLNHEDLNLNSNQIYLWICFGETKPN